MPDGKDRILTSHVGSLPRPADLLDAMKERFSGEAYDAAAYQAKLKAAIEDIVHRQADSGIDIVTDGELSKPGFFTYVRERLEGFEPRKGAGPKPFAAEVDAFPEYYEDYFARAMGGGGVVVPTDPICCVGPVCYVGQELIRQDIENLKAALGGVPHADAFMPAVAPSGTGANLYYPSEEAFFHAVGDALSEEYRAIVDAGLIVQIDDPFLSDIFAEPGLDGGDKRKRAEMYVEAINASLKGIPPERVRFHTCYGINEGPRIHEAALKDVVGHMLKVNAAYYSFEAANPRHEHEYHLWEEIKLPEGKTLLPGMITHASNIVEHPELIAERLTRFARLVGRENVIASADCGFSSIASYKTEVHPTVIWEKFKALAEGARLASARLW